MMCQQSRAAPCACRLLFSYEVLTPAALNFFVSYADGAVESLWSIDQYFEFVLVLMLSTGLSFQARPGNVKHVTLHRYSMFDMGCCTPRTTLCFQTAPLLSSLSWTSWTNRNPCIRLKNLLLLLG